MSEQKKKWYASKAVWANVLQLLMAALVGFGMVGDQASAIIQEGGSEVIVGLVTAVLAVLGLYGRVTATHKIEA